MHVTPALLWLLVLADSGAGKTKARNIAIKALRSLKTFVEKHASSLDLPDALLEHIRAAADAGCNSSWHPRHRRPVQHRASQSVDRRRRALSSFEARINEGSTAKSGGGPNMSFSLALSTGEFIRTRGKNTARYDESNATIFHLGQPSVYKSMVACGRVPYGGCAAPSGAREMVPPTGAELVGARTNRESVPR